MHCTYRALLSSAFATTATRPSILPPAFLLPSFGPQISAFSTTPTQQKRKERKDGNRIMRGISALRRTGFNLRQSPEEFRVALTSLPKPVLTDRDQPAISETHGLWGFFPKNRTALATPDYLHSHGRAWARSELRTKSWRDLHRLWWMCLKELNGLATWTEEAARVKEIYGAYEHQSREETVRKTMKAIRHTLIERWYAFDSARSKAMTDPEIDMYAQPGSTGLVQRDNERNAQELSQQSSPRESEPQRESPEHSS